MTSNDDIPHAIGKLEGQLSGLQENVALLRKDFSDEKANAHESRAVIHRRLDEQAEKINSVQTKIEIHGQIEAQLRDNITGLRETVETNISPTID